MSTFSGYLVMKTFFVCLLLLLTLGVSTSDGSDGNHHRRHHLRQRRHGSNSEWSPSEAIYERSHSNVKSQITFGQGVEHPIDVTVAKNWVFFTANGSTVKAHIGSTAVLPCEVKKDSQFGVITWSRVEDETRPYSLLTIGDQNYVEDSRYFVAKPFIGSNYLGWDLRIKRVTLDDAGRYECQATTHPSQSIITRLKVVEASTQILGTKEKIIKSGSKLQLHCALRRATEEPLYVFWYHNNRMINYDAGVTVTKDSAGSTLNLQVASVADSGNYTCSPYNIKPTSVIVHVLREGNSAASSVQDEGGQDSKVQSSTSDRIAPPSAAVQSSFATLAHQPSGCLLSLTFAAILILSPLLQLLKS